MTDTLWTPFELGAMRLPHRLAMAPMTRSRATAEGTPTALNAEYYAQRASLGLLISEGTQPSADGQGYVFTPGIYTDDHVAGWRLVSDAVHAAGGYLVVQLMHTGRIAHIDNTPHHRAPVAPSAVRAESPQMFTLGGMKPMSEPRALSTAEVEATVQDFVRAGRRAIDAGADGVEIHSANGYLVHQFLSTNANRRDDRYGGSIENRVRFGVEVAAGLVDALGADRVGVRISPGNPFNDIVEEDVHPLYEAYVTALAEVRPAYLHLMHAGDEALLKRLRALWPTALLLNRAGAPLERRFDDVREGIADVATIATQALANPDLVARVKAGAPMNEPDRATFYGGGARGYTDYPTMGQGGA